MGQTPHQYRYSARDECDGRTGVYGSQIVFRVGNAGFTQLFCAACVCAGSNDPIADKNAGCHIAGCIAISIKAVSRRYSGTVFPYSRRSVVARLKCSIPDCTHCAEVAPRVLATLIPGSQTGWLDRLSTSGRQRGLTAYLLQIIHRRRLWRLLAATS
jgi:hypothetical protein